jgi:hypothetical protein
MIDNLQKSGLKVLIQGLDGANPLGKAEWIKLMVLCLEKKRGQTTI